jgi:type-F conjugative transfer system protein TrbI
MRLRLPKPNESMALVSFLSLLIMVLSLTFKTDNPKIVSFDKQKIKAQFIRQLAQHKASKSQALKASAHFKASLEQSLNQYSLKHQVVIIDKPGILAGTKDVTEIISEELAALMRRP